MSVSTCESECAASKFKYFMSVFSVPIEFTFFSKWKKEENIWNLLFIVMNLKSSRCNKSRLRIKNICLVYCIVLLKFSHPTISFSAKKSRIAMILSGSASMKK